MIHPCDVAAKGRSGVVSGLHTPGRVKLKTKYHIFTAWTLKINRFFNQEAEPSLLSSEQTVSFESLHRINW